MVNAGRVILAGSGPGDPGLLTVAAVQAIGTADVILHDHLIPETALAEARADAEVVDVGKVGGGKHVPQDETNRLMVEHALAGRLVLRLKGGDPFVFGRGGEEAQLCRMNGIPFQIIPGITAGIAAAAYVGIPVTQRGVSAGVALITGHEAPDKPDSQLDWDALARFPGTLVFYMGVRALPHIAEQLIAAGRPAGQAAAVVERGTFSDQRAVHATLETIAERAAAESITAPAVTVVGDVAALGPELQWRGVGPLSGVSVVVTRPKAQASGLANALAEQGARVIEAAVIRTEPLAFTLPEDLTDFDLVVFSSPNGVRTFFNALRDAGLDARALAAARIAVIGPGTADALSDQNIVADLVPARAVGESLAELLATLETRNALVVRARGARTVVTDALEQQGVSRVRSGRALRDRQRTTR